MFNKVLIANRGAIACRIIRTLKEMGVGSVAVYSEADADSRHVLDADEAWSLGEGAAAHTYLDQNKLIAIAKQTGASTATISRVNRSLLYGADGYAHVLKQLDPD